MAKITLLNLTAPLLSLTLISPAIQAEEQKPEDKMFGTWETSAELSIIATSGNTETTTFRGKIDAKQELEKWSNQYIFDSLFKEEETENDEGESVKQRSAERYFASAQGNYKLKKEHSFLLIYAAHLEDKFGSFANNSIISGGYGQRIFEFDDHTMDAEIGPGYRRGERDSGEIVKGPILRASAVYRWQISENADFEQKLSVETGSGNTFSKSESYISAKVNGSLKMKFGFAISNNSVVDEGKDNVDTETTMTLVYSF